MATSATPLLAAVAQGADPKQVIPDDWVIVRGGLADLPPSGIPFSGALGRTLAEAGSGVPHNQLRVTTAGAIRARGGSVELAPEVDPRTGKMNELHVNIVEGSLGSFSEPQANPVPKALRLR